MFHTIFYEPVYNLLVIFLQVVPQHDIGVSIILMTILVKTILLPLNLSAMKSQYVMKSIEGELKDLREKYKNEPQISSQKMMEIYKREKINPFASLFVVLLQIPIFIALYLVFSKGMHLDINSLYSFVHFPELLHTEAFGILDVTKRSLVVAILTGISSYILARRQTVSMRSDKKPHEETFQDHFMKSMRMQLLYVLPVIIGFSAYVLPGALGVYWITNNVLSYLQDIYIKHHLSKKVLSKIVVVN